MTYEDDYYEYLFDNKVKGDDMTTDEIKKELERLNEYLYKLNESQRDLSEKIDKLNGKLEKVMGEERKVVDCAHPLSFRTKDSYTGVTLCGVCNKQLGSRSKQEYDDSFLKK